MIRNSCLKKEENKTKKKDPPPPGFGGRDIGKSRLLDFFYIAKS